VSDATAVVAVLAEGVAVVAEGVAVVGAHDDQPSLPAGEPVDQATEVFVRVRERGRLGLPGVATVAGVVTVGDVGGGDVDEQEQRAVDVLLGDGQRVVDLVASGVGFRGAELGPPVVTENMPALRHYVRLASWTKIVQVSRWMAMVPRLRAFASRAITLFGSLSASSTQFCVSV
jgi:hypothetical protein